MQQKMGGSRTGDLKDAVKGITQPDFLIMITSDKETFREKVEELEVLFPQVPSIACVGQGYYGTQVIEDGVIVAAMEGVKAITNVLTDVSTMPLRRIQRLEEDVQKIGGNGDNTVCIDLCSSNDECVLTTMNSVLRKHKIELTGGTVWEGLVAANGVVYEDASAYALVRNLSGKVKVYKENLYLPTETKYIVTRADASKNMLYELDGRPVADVYKEKTHVSSDKIAEQTFENPFGRVVGDEIYIVSIKEVIEQKYFSCYRKISRMDALNILELGDYEQIIDDTIHSIQSDFPKVSGVFSVNCILRYLMFKQKNFAGTYFGKMAQLGMHAGLIGLGEHYNGNFVNQTLSCVVFE